MTIWDAARRCGLALCLTSLGGGCAPSRPVANASHEPTPTVVAPARSEPPTRHLSASALYAELEAQRTAGAAQSAPGDDSEAAAQSPEWPEYCRQLVNYPTSEPMEDCQAALLGNGSTLVVRITTSCGGDSCDVLGWVYTQALGGYVKLPGDAGGTIAADPSGAFVLQDESTDVAIPHPEDVEVKDPLGGKDEIITVRIDIPSMQRTPFAACFSPSLSPAGRWFVCRNRAGDVLRLALSGGTPEIIVKAGVAPDDLRWVPYAYGYPDAVEFPSATRLRFTLDIQSDDQDSSEQREAAWSE